MKSTHKMKLDCGVLGEIGCTISYSYSPAESGNRESSGCPEEFDIHSITVTDLSHYNFDITWLVKDWAAVHEAVLADIREG